MISRVIASLTQLQHVSIWGATGGDELTDPAIGMHQATVTWRPNDWWWLQLGRFEIVYGDQRVLGAPGWNQTGRSSDGVRTGVRLVTEVRGGIEVDVEGLKLREGVHYFHAPQPRIEPLGLEFDTTLEYELHEMLKASAGHAVFLPFEGMSTVAADDPSGVGSWWHVMLTFDASVALNPLTTAR